MGPGSQFDERIEITGCRRTIGLNDFKLNTGASAQRSEFLLARNRFVGGLRSGTFPSTLRIKRVKGHEGMWELTWAPDGRATFEYGDEVIPGEAHITWRRVGTHEIFDRP